MNVVNPQSDGSSAGGLIVGLVLAAIIIGAAIIFGLPYLRNMQNQPQQEPATINVTLPTPEAPKPAPDPAPQP